jgi:hypothetical protein
VIAIPLSAGDCEKAQRQLGLEVRHIQRRRPRS